MGENHFLSNFQLFFNSGRDCIRFDDHGRMSIEERSIFLTHGDQVLLLQIIISCFLDGLCRFGMRITDEIRCQASRVDHGDLDALEELSLLVSRELGGEVRFDNKGCEVEVVMSARLLPSLESLDRDKIARKALEKLKQIKSSLAAPDIYLFWGPEYLKLTLMEKSQVVSEVLKRPFKGRVLAFGDSRVDLSFLRLKPEGIRYDAYYVGIPSEFDPGWGIFMGPAHGPEGMFEVLNVAFRDHSAGKGRIGGIIADIDNCTAPLDFPLESRMIELICRLLMDSVPVVLITGGGLRAGYVDRVVEPLKNCELVAAIPAS